MCFTCSANVRTPLNSPLVGANEYLSSGMASAAGTKSCSAIPRSKLSASPGLLAGGGLGICPSANPEQQSTTKVPNSNFAFCMYFSPDLNYLRGKLLSYD